MTVTLSSSINTNAASSKLSISKQSDYYRKKQSQVNYEQLLEKNFKTKNGRTKVAPVKADKGPQNINAYVRESKPSPLKESSYRTRIRSQSHNAPRESMVSLDEGSKMQPFDTDENISGLVKARNVRASTKFFEKKPAFGLKTDIT